MKKLVIAALAVFFCFGAFMLGKNVYLNYKSKKYRENYDLQSYRFNKMISDISTKNNIKLNDLIFVCELRKGLWNTGTNINVIQNSSLANSQNYKNLVVAIKEGIEKDPELLGYTGKKTEDMNTHIIGNFCTLVDPETQSSRSMYSDLLRKKYQITQNSIGYVDMSAITKEDMYEYEKAKSVENKIRMMY